MKIRASSMPLAVTCPASLQQPDSYTLSTENEASRLGTAVHDWLSDRLGADTKPFEHYAVKHSVKVKEVERLSLKAYRLWGEVSEYFPEPKVEVYHELKLPDMTLTGHMDVSDYHAVHRMAVVLDYKTGFLDGDHEEQIKTYGLLALDLYPEAEKVFTIILNVRDYTRDQQVYTREALNEWYANRVVNRIHFMKGTYNPGSHCRFCNFRSQCQAYKDEITNAALVIQDNGQVAVAAPLLYNSVLHIEKLCERARDWLHCHVHEAGGTVPLDDKYNLTLRSQVTQEVIVGRALPVLRKHLSPSDIADTMSIGITKLKDKIMGVTGHGQKGKAWAGTLQELDEAQALNQVVKTQLVKRKKEDAIPHDARSPPGDARVSESVPASH